MYSLVVQRLVLLKKWHLEILDVVWMNTLPSHYCLILSEYLVESTNRCYNHGDDDCTTLTYTKAKLNSLVTLERRFLLIRHDTSTQRCHQHTHQYEMWKFYAKRIKWIKWAKTPTHKIWRHQKCPASSQRHKPTHNVRNVQKKKKINYMS